MKNLLCSFLLLISLGAFSQNIEWDRRGLKVDGELVPLKNWEDHFQGNPEALALVSKARSGMGTSQVIGFIGGFMIGWPLGTAIGGGEPEWAILGAGVGLVAIALPIEAEARKKMKQAVGMVNRNSSASRGKLNFNFSGTQVGLSLSF